MAGRCVNVVEFKGIECIQRVRAVGAPVLCVQRVRGVLCDLTSCPGMQCVEVCICEK